VLCMYHNVGYPKVPSSSVYHSLSPIMTSYSVPMVRSVQHLSVNTFLVRFRRGP
jgi:hypothetical protein